MRSKIYPAKRIYKSNEWRPYFTWLPRKVFIGPRPPTNKYERPYRWVWLEYIERLPPHINDKGTFFDFNQYRLMPPKIPPKIDESLRSSETENQPEDQE